MGIQIKNITKRFKKVVVLDNISFEVNSGELVAVLGPSGSGKTTLLRVIAGLDFADSGVILIDDEEAQTKPVQERGVGFVFQHYALFKHMTVFDNVAFGLNVQTKETRPSKAEIQKIVTKLLKLVRLEKFRDQYPHQLSGGQKQRIALIRALAIQPKLLLLDEPFGALDTKVRKKLRRWIRKLHDELKLTSIFVTHDQEEALEVSDRVIVMGNGKIKQIGTPEQVWHHPANRFVYDFLGSHNEFDGWQDNEGNIHLVETDITVPESKATDSSAEILKRYPVISHFVSRLVPRTSKKKSSDPVIKKNALSEVNTGKTLKLYARPHEMYLTKTPENEEFIKAIIISINSTGALAKLELERKNGKVLKAEIPKNLIEELNLKIGDRVFIRPHQFNAYEL